jgi:hypothetical protein
MFDEKYPENNRLISLLNIYSEHMLTDNYEFVMRELVNGDSCLLLPSANDEPLNYNWRVWNQGDSPLRLSCIYEVDGIKTIGVFTDEESLFNWAKATATYTAVKTKDLLRLCEANGIYYMVINSGLPNMFVAQRDNK